MAEVEIFHNLKTLSSLLSHRVNETFISEIRGKFYSSSLHFANFSEHEVEHTT